MTRENGSVGGHRQPIKLHADPTPGGCDRSSPTSSWPPGSRSASGWVERSQSGLRRCAGRRTTSRRRAARSGTTCPVRPGTSEGCPLSGDSAARALRCRLPRRPEHRQRRDVPGNDGRPGLQRRRHGRGRRPDPGRPGGVGRGPDPLRPARDRCPAIDGSARRSRALRRQGVEPPTLATARTRRAGPSRRVPRQ